MHHSESMSGARAGTAAGMATMEATAMSISEFCVRDVVCTTRTATIANYSIDRQRQCFLLRMRKDNCDQHSRTKLSRWICDDGPQAYDLASTAVFRIQEADSPLNRGIFKAGYYDLYPVARFHQGGLAGI